ncbi:hypothetical protein Tcan_06659 [Toxocara canis]|uniref:Uncharacterized protein n=1 Tax=Toxocara canis TaxID=6265 RepID=A0A0B2V6Z5_TOXCA|nr:hypothetical protein Tcan_06659 [Toxocara canis]
MLASLGDNAVIAAKTVTAQLRFPRDQWMRRGSQHDDEKGVPDSAFLEFSYTEQSEDEYKQLDTENDQKGDTAVEHIFKKTKTVYGQPAKDMKGMVID